jgi:uncharacterized protein YjbI with pentapeptide repeats
MQKSRVEFSVLTRKAAIDASSVALGVRMASRLSTGRTTAFSHSTKGVPFVQTEQIQYEFRKPNDRVHYARLEGLTKSANDQAIRAKSLSLSAGPDIILWPEQDGSFDFKKLASIGKRGRAAAQGYDPNADDADGDMLVQDGTPWERPKTPKVSKRGQRKPGKTRVAVASGLENVADRVDQAAAKRRSRRQERGPLKERIAGRLEGAAERIEKRRSGKPSKPGDESAEKPKRSRAGLAERFGDYVLGDQRVKPSKDKPSQKPDETPDITPDNEPETNLEELAPPDITTAKPKTPVEDVTATATATEKLPGKVIGKPDDDRALAMVVARDSSLAKPNLKEGDDNKPQNVHVVKNDEGKFVVVDDERLKAMEGVTPIATFRDGKVTSLDGAPKKVNNKKVSAEKIDAAPGFGRQETNRSSAEESISNIDNTTFYVPWEKGSGKKFQDGEAAHLIESSDGKYYIVDEEKLQALGVEPIKSSRAGEGEFVYASEKPPKVTPSKPKEDIAVGEIPGEGPMEKPSLPEVSADAKKKKPKKSKLDGKQDGKYKTPTTAYVRANKLSAEDGKDRYVVEAPGGGYAVVDKDRLDAMGVEPYSSHSKGKGKTTNIGTKPEEDTPKEPDLPDFLKPKPEADKPEAEMPKEPDLPDFLKPKPKADKPEAEKPKEATPVKKLTAKKTPKQSIQYLNQEVDKAQKLYDAGDKEGATAYAKQSMATIEEARKDGLLRANEYTAESFMAQIDELRWHADGHPGLEDDTEPETPAALETPKDQVPSQLSAKPYNDLNSLIEKAKKDKDPGSFDDADALVNEMIKVRAKELMKSGLWPKDYGNDSTYAGLIKQRDDIASLREEVASAAGYGTTKPEAKKPKKPAKITPGMNLSGLDLTEYVLNDGGIELKGRDLSNTNLSGLDLSNMNMTGANLRGANLTNTSLEGVDLTDADLTGAVLDGAAIRNAELGGANFAGASLFGADLTSAHMPNANFEGADLRDTSMNGVVLLDANMTDANLMGADLSDAVMNRASLNGADLRNANLTSAALREADLSGASLNNADLPSADLRKANMSNTVMEGANLKNANLREADLESADMANVNLNGADLEGADLNSANLEGADLRDADLTNADFRQAQLESADLTGANTTGTKFDEDFNAYDKPDATSLPDGEKWKSVGKGDYEQRIKDIEDSVGEASFETPEELIAAHDVAIEETNKEISKRFQELSEAGLDSYEIGKDPVTNDLVKLSERLKAEKKFNQGAYGVGDMDEVTEASKPQSEAAKIVDESGNLVEGVSQGKARFVLQALEAENDPSNDEAIAKLTNAAAKSEAEKPTPIAPGSPSPYKTSKVITDDSLKAAGLDFADATELIESTLQPQKETLRNFISEELLVGKSLNDEDMRAWLAESYETLGLKSGIPEYDKDVAVLRAKVKTHLHNWDVLTGQGAYSESNSPGLTALDRFNHLSPNGQQSFLKELQGKYESDYPGDEAKVKELMDGFKKLTKPQGKKKMIPKETVEEFTANVEKDVAGPAPEPKQAKIDGPSMSIATVGKVAMLSPDDARSKGVPTLGAEDESKFPEGSIVGYLEMPPGKSLTKAQQEAHQTTGEKNMLPKGYKKGDLELAEITAADGSKVAVVLNTRADGFAEWDLEQTFPSAYGDDTSGVLSNWSSVGVPNADVSPDESSPLKGKKIVSMESSEVNDTKPSMPGGPVKSIYENISKALGGKPWDENEDNVHALLREKYGDDGGVIVMSPDGNFHAMSTKDWEDSFSKMTDSEKLGHDLVTKTPPKYVSWATGSKTDKHIDDVPWDELDSDAADEVLKTLFEEKQISELKELGFQTLGMFNVLNSETGEQKKNAIEFFDQNTDAAEKDPEHPLNVNGDGEWALFSIRAKGWSQDGDPKQFAIALGGEDLKFALKHPTFFGEPLWAYSSINSAGENVGEIADTGMASEALRIAENPADMSFVANGNIAGDRLASIVQEWENKLFKNAEYNPDHASKAMQDAEKRLADMNAILKDAIGDQDPKKMTIAELKKALASKTTSPDTFVGKMMETAVRLDVTKKFMATRMMAQQDALEVEQELKEMLDKNPKSIGEILKRDTQLKMEMQVASEDLSKAVAALESATTGSDLKEAYDQVNDAKARLRAAYATTKVYSDVTESHKKKFTTVFAGGEQYDLKKSSVISENAPTIEKASEIAAAIAPIMPSGASIGIFKDDIGGYTLVKMEDAIQEGMPAPQAIFSSSGVGGIPVVDSTELMNLTTAPHMPKLAEGYQGTTNLGVNSVDGKAIGQFVPTPLSADSSPIDENHPLVKEWSQKIADGASLADVPNELLKESIWANTEGGGGGSGRFKLLSKASGFNDHGKGPKDQTQRFLDTTTGQTFVIKSATRNDQEGVRELFGNQVMQMLGFPSSGGRTAGVVDKSPNKFPSFHPEYDAEADQVPILIESSEMLYDGKPLGHIRNMPSAQQNDIISRLTPESVATGVVMDSLFRYYDRQGDNWIAVELPDGSVAYHPIDHGNAFGPFKGHKFYDKDGKKVSKGKDSPADEDELGFMFSGLDGEGAWKTAKQSMNTPERRQMFAEATVNAVRRAESVDYAGEAEKLIQGQNLGGKLAGRARTSAQALEEKKGRLDSYVDPMLRELGMTDDEIAAVRAKVDAELGQGVMKASQAPKTLAPQAAAPKLYSPTPIEGEEAFGNAPAAGGKTVTLAIGQSILDPSSIHYTTAGMSGGQTKEGVRFVAFPQDGEGKSPVVSMSTRLDFETSKSIGQALASGVDAQGNMVKILEMGSGHKAYQNKGGKWNIGPNGNPITEGASFDGKYVMAQMPDGAIVIVNYDTKETGDNYSSRGLTSVFYPDSKPDAAKVASTLSSLGVSDIGYVNDDGWKMRAAGMLARTFDKELLNSEESIAVRLARVASEKGITVNDLEPYHDSMGRLRFRLSDEGYKTLLEKHPKLADTTHFAKSMGTYDDGSNVVRLIKSGGQVSKAEQVMSGSGLSGGSAEGKGGHGASPMTDLMSGGGDGLFMSAFAGGSAGLGSSGGQHVNATFWGTGKDTFVVLDAEQQMRDIGWWAHGPNDGPYGALNPTSSNGITAKNMGSTDPISLLENGKVFEFMGNGTTPLEHISFIILPPASRIKAIAKLKADGITEINGKPIAEFIVSSKAGSKVRAALGPKWTKSKFGSIATPKKASPAEIAEQAYAEATTA